VDISGPYPMHGEVEWLSPEDGGRKKPPVGPTYAVTGHRSDVALDAGLASFVLRGFDPTKSRSRADGRWLFPEVAGEFAIKPGVTVVVTEGRRPVAFFHIDAVDGNEGRSG
jgi:hypothetical protein